MENLILLIISFLAGIFAERYIINPEHHRQKRIERKLEEKIRKIKENEIQQS